MKGKKKIRKEEGKEGKNEVKKEREKKKEWAPIF